MLLRGLRLAAAEVGGIEAAFGYRNVETRSGSDRAARAMLLPRIELVSSN
jgi:hypothetical protein